jgi:hypothetical protein
MSALPAITYTIPLDEGLIPDLMLEAVRGSDFALEAVLTRAGAAIDHEGLQLRFNASTPDRETWVRTVTGTAAGTAATRVSVAIPDTTLDNSGRMLFDLVVLSGSLVVIHARGVLVLYPNVPDSGTLPAGNVVDFGKYSGYANVAAFGPVRPDGVTTEVAVTNPDGSIKIGVKPGVYDPAGSAAAAQAAAEAASLPLLGTAADANPAGTLLAGALALKADDDEVVKLTGNQTVSGRKTFVDATGAITRTFFERLSSGVLGIIMGGSANFRTNGLFGFAVQDRADLVGGVDGTDRTLFAVGNTAGEDLISMNVFGSVSGNSTAVVDGVLGFATAGFARLKRLTTAVLRVLKAETSDGLALQDSAGAEHALLTSTGLRIRPRVVSSSITAELDGVYHGVATATYTDPTTPAEGRGFAVRVVNGTATVGGTAYAAEGTVIMREFHSGAWRNRVLFGGADAAGVRAAIDVQAAPVTTTTSQGTSYSWQPSRNGDVLKLTLTGAVALTLSDPATATVPLHVTVEAIQDGTGGRVLTLAGNVSTPGAVQPTLSATANAVDLLQFVWTGAKWRWVNSSYAQGNL